MFGSLDGIETVMPEAKEIDRIQDIYKDFVEGRGTDAQAQELREFARTFVARDGAEAVLIAGTDLSTVFAESNAGFPMLDCAHVHIDAIVKRLLEQD
jgi:aspartate racemase